MQLTKLAWSEFKAEIKGSPTVNVLIENEDSRFSNDFREEYKLINLLKFA